ncbi:hypothetical protein [Nostoc sp.]|uniref:hypothetical protein n=1 Tax=Nostoc sp. TaxID=1180 RepID=UPI003593F059
MALYGYTIGDADISSATGNQFPVYRFPLTLPRTPELVQVVNVPDIANPDLEGLGTNPLTGRVSAVNEPDSFGPPTIDPTLRFGNIDSPGPAVQFNGIYNTATVTNRFGTETGADFGRDFSRGTPGNRPVVLYALGANDDANSVPGGSAEPVGSSLYKISVGGSTNPNPSPTVAPDTVNLIDSTPTDRERAGLSPTNGINNGFRDGDRDGIPNESNDGVLVAKYADGLAVDNLVLGPTRAFASDFRTSDGDGNQLHKVDLLTGQLSAPIQIRTTGGTPTTYNLDSGLAFTQESPNGLFALLEDGTLLRFSNFTDELNAPGLRVLGGYSGGTANGFVTVDILTPVALPASGGEYEGFTIVNE